MANYDEIAEEYKRRRHDKTFLNYNRDIEIPAFIRLVGNVKKKKILDLGCGFGDHLGKLSKQKPASMVGLDISSSLIEIAKEKKLKNTTFLVRDMSKKLPFKNSSFDVVISSLAIHYLKNPKKLFKEINRVLKKGGIFCFSTGHPVFNLIKQSDERLIGVRTSKNGKKEILGDYFTEKLHSHDFGGKIGKVKLYHITFETLIRSALENGFELLDYRETKPLKSAKKSDPFSYKLTSTLPTFIILKLKKK